MRALKRGAGKNGYAPHIWTFIVVYQLSEEQAKRLGGFGEQDQERVNLGQTMVQQTSGPSCWLCDMTYEQGREKPCQGPKKNP